MEILKLRGELDGMKKHVSESYENDELFNVYDMNKLTEDGYIYLVGINIEKDRVDEVWENYVMGSSS